MSESDNLPVPAYKTLRWDKNAYLLVCFEALRMRTDGKGYRMIAEAQGVDVATAHKRVRDAILANGAKDAETERELDLERLDGYLSLIHAQMREGSLNFQDALRIMDRRAKLLGLDTPVKAEVTTRDGMDVDLADIMAKAKAAEDAADADINS